MAEIENGVADRDLLAEGELRHPDEERVVTRLDFNQALVEARVTLEGGETLTLRTRHYDTQRVESERERLLAEQARWAAILANPARIEVLLTNLQMERDELTAIESQLEALRAAALER